MSNDTNTSTADSTRTTEIPTEQQSSAGNREDGPGADADRSSPRSERTLTSGRRDVLRALGGAAVAGLAWSASGPASAAGAQFGNGVNLMPSYYCDGDQDLGWDLMTQQDAIQAVRIEIEPFSFGEVATTRDDAKRWIDEAAANGYDVIATYHHYPDNGSADPQALQDAADFWAEHYEYLSRDASFTINLMNEWGNHDVSASDYAAAYDSAIQTVRSSTSYRAPIICDAPGWGQETHRLAEAVEDIGDDNLILSAHVYGDGWNKEVEEDLQPEHLDVLDETDYPCMIGEFGANRDGPVDWSAVIDHANDLGWPVFAWAWNGDGSDDPMNLANPYWGNDCSADTYTTTPYFDEIYPKLQDGTGTGGGRDTGDSETDGGSGRDSAGGDTGGNGADGTGTGGAETGGSGSDGTDTGGDDTGGSDTGGADTGGGDAGDTGSSDGSGSAADTGGSGNWWESDDGDGSSGSWWGASSDESGGSWWGSGDDGSTGWW